MIFLREMTAIVLWVTSLILILICVFSEFSSARIFIAMICLVAAYFIWPSKQSGRRDDNHWWLDLAELLIEGPILLVRLIIKLLD